jgi:hypothetical protein
MQRLGLARGFRWRPDIYGNGVVLLGFPCKQTRAREIWASRWCYKHSDKERRGRRMVDGNLLPCR